VKCFGVVRSQCGDDERKRMPGSKEENITLHVSWSTNTAHFPWEA